MKLLFSFWILLLGTSMWAQDSAIINYNKKVELLLTKIETNTINGDEKKDLKAIAFDLQNRGQILDESQHDYVRSLVLVSKAITIFRYIGDTLSIANNLKFRGYLLARFGKFVEAKTEIKEAISLFQSKNKDWGVAVSHFDLSRVYEFENKIDSAIYYCMAAIDYWKSKNVASRIFGIQSMLMNLLIKANHLPQAKSLQENSEKLSTNPELGWQDMLDFYFVSGHLYKTTNEFALSTKYQQLYSNKLTELKKEGITAKSYFDIP